MTEKANVIIRQKQASKDRQEEAHVPDTTELQSFLSFKITNCFLGVHGMINE